MEMKHGGHLVHHGVATWETARQQEGELTTGVQSYQTAYEVDDADYSSYTGRWHCSMPGCSKDFSNRNGYECHLKSGAHESALYQCQGCGKEFRRLADLNAHATQSSCGAASAGGSRTSRQLRTFVHDAQQSQLMIADGSVQQQHYHEATLKFDGGAQPNPGIGGWGYVLYDDSGYKMDENSGAAGSYVTNNQAEYSGLIAGLEAAKRHGIRRLEVQGDSELIINQMTGVYRVTSDKMRPLHAEAKELQSRFIRVDFGHIPREENEEADALARLAIDSQRFEDAYAYSY
jgi:ribonuclease HI